MNINLPLRYVKGDFFWITGKESSSSEISATIRKSIV